MILWKSLWWKVRESRSHHGHREEEEDTTLVLDVSAGLQKSKERKVNIHVSDYSVTLQTMEEWTLTRISTCTMDL